MLCEYNLCIYQKDGECTLNEIEINSLGMCDDCILPNIDDNTLEEAKEKLLKTYEDEDSNF